MKKAFIIILLWIVMSTILYPLRNWIGYDVIFFILFIAAVGIYIRFAKRIEEKDEN
ncbi:hypothetical protein GCM10011510_07890 [Streptococcus himalayensis]|uniref:Uncharacterized protein n=1 Tax=Streptococcus himalayensis TaxID=1888195 RepID=A0A917A5V4_9STRE|nr:hypothetical protein GCM10011510_07890 [Streptococcus himalayensis]